MTRYVIALDQGTSSCRAFAVDKNGVVRAQQSVVFSPLRAQKGFSEYKAEELLQAQVGVLNRLLDEIGPEKVDAIGVCSQRSTVVLWDKTTGQALAPVLTWEDARSASQADQAAITQEEVHARTGLFKTPYFSAPKIAWCLQNYPAAQQAAQKGTLLAAPVASYLIWQLTDGAVFATDPTLAQRTLLWNIHSATWSEELRAVFGVSSVILPNVLPSAAGYGTYTYKGVKIALGACVADQQAAAVYHGLSAGKTGINYGTGAFVLHHTGEKVNVLPGMLSSVAATTYPGEKAYLLEGPVFSAGSVLQWLKAKGIQFDVEHIDSLCAKCKKPLFLLPALGGLGAPFWDYKVGPQTEGLTPQTEPSAWVAGALHAIAGRVADIIYYLRANGLALREPMYVSGGLARSQYLLQQQANILGAPLQLQPETEHTVLGCACLAAKQAGWNTQTWVRQNGRIISPAVSGQEALAIYQTWHRFVARCRQK